MTGPRPSLRRTESVMGTMATVELRPPLPMRLADRLLTEVFGWLHEVDARFSTYRADSEVSRLNRGEIALADCSDDMRLVLAECARLWQGTDGYFGAYANGQLDPAGFVKGWSVQVASERLAAAGAGNHFVDAGGGIPTPGRPGPGPRRVIPRPPPWG